jgi:hypothetical protein
MSLNAIVAMDIFKSDGLSIDVQKVVFKLWEHRKHSDNLNGLAEVLR